MKLDATPLASTLGDDQLSQPRLRIGLQGKWVTPNVRTVAAE
jgi:hypothetical protein